MLPDTRLYPSPKVLCDNEEKITYNSPAEHKEALWFGFFCIWQAEGILSLDLNIAVCLLGDYLFFLSPDTGTHKIYLTFSRCSTRTKPHNLFWRNRQ